MPSPTDNALSSIRQRLRQSLQLPHLAAWPDVTPDDEEAFQRYSRDLTANYAVLAASFMLFAVLAWWPLDLVVSPDAVYASQVSVIRISASTLLVAAFLAFTLSDHVRRRSLLWGTFFYSAVMGAFAFGLGRIGGPDQPWFADSLIGVVPLALMPLPFAQRAAVVGTVSLTMLGAFFLPFPAHRANSFALGQVSFMVFAWAISVVTGELLQRTVRRSFFQQRSIKRARREVAALNATLSERVAEQTQELRTLAAHLERAQEMERRRLARDLHDELGQELTAMRLTLSLMQQRYADKPLAIGALLGQLVELNRRATATTRNIVSGLHPKVLEDLGLIEALRHIARTVEASGSVTAAFELHGPSPDLLSPDAAVAMFRVAQESCTNALKHAGASRITLRLVCTGVGVELSVEDDGAGLNQPSDTPGLGLGVIGMRERMRALGGHFQIQSTPGGGTRVVARIDEGET